MRRDPGAGEFERLVAERGDELMRAAVALTGRREDAEDLLQEALERLLRNWRSVQADREGYLRRTLYNLAADGWRRKGTWRQKVPLLRAERRVGGAGTGADDTAAVDARDVLVRLLRQLPPQQRAVLVLRYFEQLTEGEAAAVLGCSEGAVKSAGSRGLRRLRELAASGQAPGIPPARGGGGPRAQSAGRGPAEGSVNAQAHALGTGRAAGIKLTEGRS